ncbi:2'-5' RNA ligase family protein [Dactylosporangium sp. CS-033363]|uniref:2'-5' RNA ligase family protein n=1 Tax=Dactylosporangium sp. CS-033363 TaxID=3239935 RepID=UPI003D91CACF
MPDPVLDSGIRALWDRLLAAGLPSLATHRHPTNRPHLTLHTLPTLASLPPLTLPVAAHLGPVRLLGRALVRSVTPTAELLALRPGGDWVPHISLALNVPPPVRAAALALLADVPDAHGQFVAARSYDTETRTVTAL